jgi:hypothetical protein
LHTNAFEAVLQAEKLPHPSKDESEIDVGEYLTNTHILYIESGETNKVLIIRRLHSKLDPTLAAAVTLNPVYNTMADFTAKKYAAETQARRQFNQFNVHFLAQEKQLEDMKKSTNWKQPQSQLGTPQNRNTPKYIPIVALLGSGNGPREDSAQESSTDALVCEQIKNRLVYIPASRPSTASTRLKGH